jgi:hypothetical protein
LLKEGDNMAEEQEIIKKKAGKPKDIDVEVLPAKKDNPYLAKARINAAQEVEQKVELYGKAETLAEVVQQFEQLREIAAAMGKKNDIYHVSKIDVYLQEVLDIITCDEALDGLKANVIATFQKGDLREVRALMQTIKDIAETKDLLSQSFDEGRTGGQKKKLKLELAFKNNDGSMVAAKAEV